MAGAVSLDFLAQLEKLYPGDGKGKVNRWPFIAAVAFSAANLPEAVPLVFTYAVQDLHDDADRLSLVRKMKDAIFKSGLLSGYPKAINALTLLHDVVPEHLRDVALLRDPSLSVNNLRREGQDLFSRTYGDTADAVQKTLKDAYPDLEHFTIAFGYGYTYGFTGAINAVETSFTMISALIASDVPKQITWHLQGALRNGASEDEVRAVRQIAMEVSRVAGVVWKHEVPDLDL